MTGGAAQAHRATSVQREALPILTAVDLSRKTFHFLGMFGPCCAGLGVGFIAVLRRTRKPKPAPTATHLLGAAPEIKQLAPPATEARRIVLLGKTGQGKSTVGNRLHGEEVFKTSYGFSSETKGIHSKVSRQLAQRDFSPYNLEVIDTEGFLAFLGSL